jgi:anhydro-N-acetylmuramic acid kinase
MSDPAQAALIALLRKRRRRMIGLMSGTSADGLDLALVDVQDSRGGPEFKVRAVETLFYPSAMRKCIHDLMDSAVCEYETLVRMHYRWAEFAAGAVRGFLRTRSIPAHTVDALASHGQTVAHYPVWKPFHGGGSRGTLQIGDPAVLARLSGLPTIGDFRWSDIAAGGTGAPLSGYYHHLMLSRLAKPGIRQLPPAVLNIGGMANISISRGAIPKLTVIAFDTGPGNCLSDTMMRLWGKRSYDRNGNLAARGRVERTTLTKMLHHPYLRRRPPKSCGKEEFGAQFITRLYRNAPKNSAALADRLATANELVACSIAGGQKWLGKIGGVVVTGGGRHNRQLMERIGRQFAPTPLISCDYLGLPGDFIEAIGFALLAHETLAGRAGNLGGATGGAPAILGKLCLPR